MTRQIMLLPFIALFCNVALSQTELQQRIAEADNLFVNDGAVSHPQLVPERNAMARHAPRGNIRFAATKRINTKELLRGYSPGRKVAGRSFWTSNNILQFGMFDGELVYLENIRIYDINRNAIGWNGRILTGDGTRIGSARFQIFDNDNVHGHFYLPGRVRIEIKPIEGTHDHDIVEFHLLTSERPIEREDTRTHAEMAAADEHWRQKRAGPEYAAIRRKQDELLQLVRQAEDPEALTASEYDALRQKHNEVVQEIQKLNADQAGSDD